MKHFKNAEVQPVVNYLNIGELNIRYLELVRDSTLPYVVFIHGAPGSLSDYEAYFKDKKLYSKLNLLSIDRPGYGYSNFGNSETSIKRQSKTIHSAIEKICQNNQVIIVGHSYGGPIALRMAIDYPSAYKGLILLAPALDPENEKVIKLARIPMIQPFRWLTPPALKVAADEKNTHIEELQKMLGYYDQLKIPVCHIHGDEDSLVPYENLDFSIKHIPTEILETVTLEDADHFLPWSHHRLVVDKIIEMSANKYANRPSK